ncbi:MAG: cysteine ABC transporter ATP-binding protein, partial [Eggerthellaceae bacterium]|nr:cysteine ABC transporter ATP-binding protein [Eggerthellaceae bacterium]
MLSLVESADSILVLDAGSVVEQGTHAQLLAQGGHYARLCESQMRLERIAGAYDARDAAREASEAPDARGSAEAYGTDEASEMPDGISSRLASATAACEREAAAVVSEGAAAAGAFAGSAQSVGTSGVGDSHVGDALDSAGVTGAVQAPRKRSGLSIMKDMLALLGSLRPHMILAITLGVVGFLAGIFLTTFGAYGMLDGIGRPAGIALVLACVLVFACGAVRGPLRYGEQLTNHFIAFKLLAVIRDRIYGALRRLAPAKLEGRDKGDLVSLVTSDIELLEVFYAHTISPVAIAIIVSVVMVVYFLVHSLVLALVAVVGYVLVGIVFPLIASRLSGAAGLRLREGAADLTSSVRDSLRGRRALLQFGGAEHRAELVRSQTRSLDVDELALKRTSAVVSAVCDVVIVALDVAMIVLSLFLVGEGGLSLQAAFVCSAAFMASVAAVVAIMRLGTGLQPTLASGQRVLERLGEQPVVADVIDGADVAFAGAA